MARKEELQSTIEQGRAYMEYGRDLFANYLDTHGGTVFTTLGYTDRQKTDTKRALGTMSEVEGWYMNNPPRVRYSQVDRTREIIYESMLSGLKSGGYKLFAGYLFQLGDNMTSAIQYMNGSKTSIADERMLRALAVIEVLPEGIGVQDIDGLVGQLYDGGWSHNLLEKNNISNMTRVDIRGFFKNFLSRSRANYRAGWIDDTTKLELAVETDVFHKLGDGFTDKLNGGLIREVWRRLPETISDDGKVWIPFAKKPNPSEAQMQKALEGKKSHSFAGKKVMESNQ